MEISKIVDGGKLCFSRCRKKYLIIILTGEPATLKDVRETIKNLNCGYIKQMIYLLTQSTLWQKTKNIKGIGGLKAIILGCTILINYT